MRQILLTATLLLSLSAVPAPAQTRCQQLPNPNPNPRPGGQIGCSVVLLGDALALGAHLDGAGSVTLCQRATRERDWSCGPKLVSSDGQSEDEFGRSVGLWEDWLAVGSRSANASGAVYLFQKNAGGAWVEKQKLSVSSAARGAQFGLVLSLSGGTLLVGAPNSTGIAGSLSGAVYVFRLNDGTWTQNQKLTASDAAAFDNFGFSVSVDGSTAVVGAPFREEGRVDESSGAVYVFELSGGAWRERARLTPGDGAAGAQFGSAVALSGDALAVGARGVDENRGSVRIYERGDAGWAEEARFFGEAGGDQFGVAASISGDRLLVGAMLNAASGKESGAAYLFERRRTPDGTFRWERDGDPLRGAEAGDRFGQAVSIDGRDLLVGAHLADTGGARDAGSATICREGNGPDPPKPEIVVVKTDGVTKIAPGETVTYTITVSNIGKGAAPEVLVTDRFSAKLTGVSWCAPQVGQSCANPVQGNINRTISLAPGQSVVFTATGTVKANAKGTLFNSACAQLPKEDPVCDEDPPDEIEDPDPTVDLELDLAPLAIPLVAKAGERVSFEATITNHGPDTATQVILRVPDPLEPPVSLRPVSSSLPEACKIERTQFVCRFAKLAPKDQPITLQLHFEVTDGCATRVVNQGRVSSSEKDINEDNNFSEAPIDITRTASLEVEKTGPDIIEPGDAIPYTVKVTNLGPDLACGVVLSDPVPTGLVSPVVPDGCGLTAGVIRCPIGELPAGQSRTFSLGFTVPEETACESEIANVATVTGTGSDPRTATAMAVVCDDKIFDLSISKTAGAATAEPGEALSYEIVVSNLGNTTVDATVTDVFPAELTNVRWCRDVAALPPCTPGTAGDLQDTVSLAAGATATYRVAGIVAAMFTGTLSNTASVALPPELTDETPGNNSSTAETVISFSGVKVFCTDISGVNLEGETITYTFVLLNGGPAVQMDNPGAEFTDLLPAGLTVVGTSTTSGVVSAPPGNPVTWNGSIPVGGMVTITISATIGAGTAGTAICNQASIAFDADGDGTNESSGSSDACCFPVLLASAIPALSASGLVALALLLAVLALARLRPPLAGKR